MSEIEQAVGECEICLMATGNNPAQLDERDRCSKSKRECGHHCDHVVTHDGCCWCMTEPYAEQEGEGASIPKFWCPDCLEFSTDGIGSCRCESASDFERVPTQHICQEAPTCLACDARHAWEAQP